VVDLRKAHRVWIGQDLHGVAAGDPDHVARGENGLAESVVEQFGETVRRAAVGTRNDVREHGDRVVVHLPELGAVHAVVRREQQSRAVHVERLISGCEARGVDLVEGGAVLGVERGEGKSVVSRPTEKRIVPTASRTGTRMASSTCETCTSSA